MVREVVFGMVNIRAASHHGLTSRWHAITVQSKEAWERNKKGKSLITSTVKGGFQTQSVIPRKPKAPCFDQ